MIITEYISLRDFPFWGNAATVASMIRDTEWDMLEGMVSDLFNGEPVNKTELNDFFSFDTDVVADLLGYSDYEEMLKERY